MGRRNSLFSGSEGGAESWAILASIVNTAKLHKLDPQAYLADVLERFVSGQPKSHRLRELLAWNRKAAHQRTAARGMSPRRHKASSSMPAPPNYQRGAGAELVVLRAELLLAARQSR
jgi:hypothetical protein